MIHTLEQFLRADTLDEAARLAGQLGNVAGQEKTVITALIEQWDDEQAIANLLMHPQLIPADVRWDTLMRGLHHLLDSYYVLAALVGLQRYETGIPEHDRSVIASRLLAIIQSSPGVPAAQASVDLFDLSQPEDGDTLASLLGQVDQDATTRHNVMAALVNSCKLDSQSVIDRAFAEGKLSASVKSYADQQLEEATPFLKAAERDEAEWYLSDLSAPLLVSIPDLSEYSRSNEV